MKEQKRKIFTIKEKERTKEKERSSWGGRKPISKRGGRRERQPQKSGASVKQNHSRASDQEGNRGPHLPLVNCDLRTEDSLLSERDQKGEGEGERSVA